MPGVKWCLPPADADEFKRGIISGDIDPLKLAEMNSKQRRAFFANWFGDSTGAAMNLEFEKSLLLKNQQQGMVNWAKKMMAKESPKRREDMISRIQKLDKVLDAKDEDAFLGDLAAQKLGLSVSFEEAKRISELSKEVEAAREKMAAGGDRMEYGHAVVELQNYVAHLKLEAGKQPLSYYAHNLGDAAVEAGKFIGGNSKAILSSLDMSAIGRQGLPVLASHPSVWAKNSRRSFEYAVKTFGSDAVMDAVMADIVSRPTHDMMRRAGVAIGGQEEAYPETIAEKIPYAGRAFKASEVAYQGFLRKTRADLFDLYLKIWQQGNDGEIDDRELRGIGTLVNSLTGRADLRPGLENVAKILNHLLFSPRMMASKWDRLTAHMLDPHATTFTKKRAALNLFRSLLMWGTFLIIAKAINDESVDLDLTSPTFGKISHRTKTRSDVLLAGIADALGITTNTYKHKPTTYDVGGGDSGYVTLAARIAKTMVRLIRDDKSKPKRDTWRDSESFFENKAAPLPTVGRDVLREKTFSGQRPTIAGEAQQLVVPLPIQNLIEQMQELKYNQQRGYK